MDEWRGLCNRAGIRLIEDCAQAHLASSQGVTAGAFGVAGAYSFNPTRNLGAPGDAGMLVTNDATIAQRVSRLRNYGQSVRYQHPELGMYSRLDEVHAAMLSERLGWLDSFTQRRREIAEHYRREIRNPRIELPGAPEAATAHVYHLFVVNCAQRDALQAHLQARQVQSNIHYPIPIHHQEPCRGLGRDPAGLEHSERHAATCLSLPCHPQLTSADVNAVIDACNSFGAA
jgi:dTDP-4-amino-4,6-dideoxygalactose transaminase